MIPYDQGECLYTLARLIKSDAPSGICVLTTSTMKHLKMRKANTDEKKKILEAINSKAAAIDYMYGDTEARLRRKLE